MNKLTIFFLFLTLCCSSFGSFLSNDRDYFPNSAPPVGEPLNITGNYCVHGTTLNVIDNVPLDIIGEQSYSFCVRSSTNEVYWNGTTFAAIINSTGTYYIFTTPTLSCYFVDYNYTKYIEDFKEYKRVGSYKAPNARSLALQLPSQIDYMPISDEKWNNFVTRDVCDYYLGGASDAGAPASLFENYQQQLVSGGPCILRWAKIKYGLNIPISFSAGQFFPGLITTFGVFGNKRNYVVGSTPFTQVEIIDSTTNLNNIVTLIPSCNNAPDYSLFWNSEQVYNNDQACLNVTV